MQDKNIHVDLEQYGDYASLKCPVCGHDNVAPTQLNVIGGIGTTRDIGTRVDHSGTSVYETPTFGRGVQIELTFNCECRHSFIYELRFHKGQTHLRLREYPYQNGHVIWRD